MGFNLGSERCVVKRVDQVKLPRLAGSNLRFLLINISLTRRLSAIISPPSLVYHDSINVVTTYYICEHASSPGPIFCKDKRIYERWAKDLDSNS
jgi:hypothetical protein